MRHEDIDRVITRLRERHPELREPVTWHGLRRVLFRERIRVMSAPIDSDAMLVSQFGVSIILLNSDLPPRRATYRVAHELGHALLHADDPTEPVFHMSACWPDDVREDDAEYFATCLLQGPAVAILDEAELPPMRVEWQKPAPPPPRPQLELLDENALDVYLDPITAMIRQDRRARRRGAVRPLPKVRTMMENPADDGFRLEREGDRLRLRDPQGKAWTVWDAVFMKGRHRRVPHQDRRATSRIFVPPDPAEMLRSYRFTVGELRDLELRDLVRQWKHSAFSRREPPAQPNVDPR